MGLLDNATQAAELRAEQNAAAAVAHPLRCEERDLTFARQWWHDNIAEPGAQFWLPKGWMAYGGDNDKPHSVVITCDGWAFNFVPGWKESHYEQPRDVAFVIYDIDQWGRPKVWGAHYLHRAEIKDLASMGRALAEAEEKFGEAIEALADAGYGQLMLEGKY